jgi:hypothetical protein
MIVKTIIIHFYVTVNQKTTHRVYKFRILHVENFVLIFLTIYSSLEIFLRIYRTLEILKRSKQFYEFVLSMSDFLSYSVDNLESLFYKL